MPPSRLECKVLSESLDAYGKTSKTLSDIKRAVTRLVTLKSKINFGIIDIVDSIGAEVVAAISSVALKVGEDVFGNVSKMASVITERIYSALLTILLAFPTSIFSLVSIPHEAAKKSTTREYMYLRRAEQNLKRIVYIIIKWTKGKSGSEFRDKMVRALPYIIRAINLTKELLVGLKGDDDSGDTASVNAVFKKGVYNNIRSNLKNAIDISRPESNLEKLLQINKRIENNKSKIYDEKAVKIKQEYGVRKKSLSDWYRDESIKSNPSGRPKDRLQDATKDHGLNVLYKQRLDNLNVWRDEMLAIANIESETESLRDKDTWIGAFRSLSDSFSDDMKVLQDELFDMLENLKNAYLQNKLSQLHCNTIYKTRSLITNLISEMIGYLRSAGNLTTNTLIDPIENAQSLMEIARDKYEGAIEPDKELSSSEYAITLALGHGSLVIADTTLSSTITDSLIQMINADDVLSAENEEFDEFIARIHSIPDWDGELGVWGVDITESALTPYIQLIADATEMLAKIPILSLRNRESDRRRVSSLVSKVNKDFKTLVRHNQRVMSVLNSYTPYVGSEAGNLKRILSNAGLLNEFAKTMSFSALMLNLASNYKESVNSDDNPTYDNCINSYPDLFNSSSINVGASDAAINMRDPKLENDFQSDIEENESDKKVMNARFTIEKANYGRTVGYDDSNMLS